MSQQESTVLAVKCVNTQTGNQRTGEVVGTIYWDSKRRSLCTSVVWNDLGPRRGTVDIRLGQQGTFFYTVALDTAPT